MNKHRERQREETDSKISTILLVPKAWHALGCIDLKVGTLHCRQNPISEMKSELILYQPR